MPPWAPLFVILAGPVYVLVMAGVLAVCGVKRSDIAKWALRQADRQRMRDLMSAAKELRTPAVAGKSPAPEVRTPPTKADA
jgi:hypothetical protein